jgi:hypothetical protein
VRGRPVTLMIFGAMALLGVALVLVLVLKDTGTAEDQRGALQQAVSVVGALSCERGVRLAQPGDTTATTNFPAQLQKQGYVEISIQCQRYVELLGRDLQYDPKTGRVTLDVTP